jgi:Na+-translocating ferredoxin:NAD+ oxidoreductase RnfG subunit
MRDYRDLAVVASLFLGGVILAILFFWLTGNAVAEQRDSRLRSALAELAGDVPVGEPEEVQEPPVLRLYPLESGASAYIVELSVLGYRDEVHFLARLSRGGTVEGVYVLSDGEDPAYDWFLRDRELLRSALNRREPAEAVAGATVTVRALSEAIDAARGVLEEL